MNFNKGRNVAESFTPTCVLRQRGTVGDATLLLFLKHRNYSQLLWLMKGVESRYSDYFHEKDKENSVY